MYNMEMDTYNWVHSFRGLWMWFKMDIKSANLWKQNKLIEKIYYTKSCNTMIIIIQLCLNGSDILNRHMIDIATKI